MFIFPYSNSGWVLCSVFTSDSVTSFLLSYSRLGCRETAVSQLPTVGAYSIAQCSAWGSREGQVESYSKLRAISTHTHTSHDIEICRKHTGLNASITCTVYLCQICLLTRITLWFLQPEFFPADSYSHWGKLPFSTGLYLKRKSILPHSLPWNLGTHMCNINTCYK